MHALQRRVIDVGVDVFGPESIYDQQERLLRFFEEACELVRVGGLSISQMQTILDFEASRPVGPSLTQEFGGAGVTLMAAAAVFQRDLIACTELEITRVALNKAKIQEKARKKPAHVHAVQPLQAAE